MIMMVRSKEKGELKEGGREENEGVGRERGRKRKRIRLLVTAALTIFSGGRRIRRETGLIQQCVFGKG